MHRIGWRESSKTKTKLNPRTMNINKVIGFIITFLLLSVFFACKEKTGGIIEFTSEPNDQSINITGQVLPKNEVDKSVTITTDFNSKITSQPRRSGFDNLLAELQIVYIKEKNIWLWSKDKGNRQLTQSGAVHQIQVGSDDQLVAYVQQVDDYHGELWVIDLNGQNERRILGVFELDELGSGARDPNSVAINPYQFSWIPGTRKIAFNTRQVFQDSSFIRLDDLNWVDIDSLERRTIILPFQGGNYRYSPDGSLIAVSTPNEVSIITADGAKRNSVLTYDQVISYSEQKYYADPIWSPNTKTLYVAIPPPDPLADPRNPTTLWEIPATDLKAIQIGSVIAQPYIDSEVVFSPDLNKIVFLRETGNPSENMTEVVIASKDGTAEQLVQKGKFVQLLAWSPDSNFFVFKQGENWEAKILKNGNQIEPLMGDPFGIYNLKWVDDEAFLILKENGVNFSLILSSLQGDILIVDEIPSPPTDFEFIH
jgi:dipeptidyl aminopeptidase/acylaminoacyl peptidase